MNDKEIDALLAKTTTLSDIDERESKIARISSDPRPQFQPEPTRDYPTTEKHYIICVDEERANESLPDAKSIYGVPHKTGGVLISDRLIVPSGWLKQPARGTAIETVEAEYPALFQALKDKKIATF